MRRIRCLTFLSLLLVVVLTLVSVLPAIAVASPVPGPTVSMTGYDLADGQSNPQGITAGPDGALWFTEYDGNKIGRITTSGTITEYGSGSGPWGISAGPDGALWFTEYDGNKIGRITTSGTITEYIVPTSNSNPQGITAGPDGALWFTEYGGNKIGRITTSGTITEYGSGSGPWGISAGPDGALWFTEYGGNKIGRITTSGTITEYAIPTSNSYPQGITAGPDGALWFTEWSGSNIGRITTSGAITEYAVPASGGNSSHPEGITAGPDGALWFAENRGNIVGRLTVSGTLTEYGDALAPDWEGGAQGITKGPDGALWFTVYADYVSPVPDSSSGIMRAQPTVTSTFYFAEGTCRPNFDTYFCIQNPGDTAANVTITYMKGDGTTVTQTLTVPKHSRSTVSARDRLGTADDSAHDFSARVDCTNKQPIVVERPMYFNYKEVWTGGSAAVGAISTASAFYFAEGTCRPNFETYFCIQNPGNTSAKVTITYTKGDATADSQTLTVARHSRSTVRVKDKLGEGDDSAHDFSSAVSCTNGQGILVERPMYFNYKGVWTGGSDVIGTTGQTSDWYVAEGTTRSSSDGEFQEWLCILNPQSWTAYVDVTYMLENGQNSDKTYECPPASRTTVNVNTDVGTGHDVSAVIHSEPHMINPDPHVPTAPSPIVVERVMYFNYKEVWTGGSAALGATGEATDFYFAEGTCRPNFDTYFSIQNPGDTAADVTITYMKGDGTTATQSLTVPKGSRSTVSARDKLGTGDDPAHDFSSAVECTNGQDIIVERPMYFDYNGWTGGHDVVGFTP